MSVLRHQIRQVDCLLAIQELAFLENPEIMHSMVVTRGVLILPFLIIRFERLLEEIRW